MLTYADRHKDPKIPEKKNESIFAKTLIAIIPCKMKQTAKHEEQAALT
jgi:hypothetical protein